MMRNINKRSYLRILDPSQMAMQCNPLTGHSILLFTAGYIRVLQNVTAIIRVSFIIFIFISNVYYLYDYADSVHVKSDTDYLKVSPDVNAL